MKKSKKLIKIFDANLIKWMGQLLNEFNENCIYTHLLRNK